MPACSGSCGSRNLRTKTLHGLMGTVAGSERHPLRRKYVSCANSTWGPIQLCVICACKQPIYVPASLARILLRAAV